MKVRTAVRRYEFEMTQPVQPLRCPNCGAPLSDTDADQVTCKFCGTTSRLVRDSFGERRPFMVTPEGAAKLNAYAQQIERERQASEATMGQQRARRAALLLIFGLLVTAVSFAILVLAYATLWR